MRKKAIRKLFDTWMKRVVRAVCLLIFAISLFYSTAHAGEGMKIVYFNNFPPVSWEDPQNQQMRGMREDGTLQAIYDKY